MLGLMERIAAAKDMQQKIKAEQQAQSEAETARATLISNRDQIDTKLAAMTSDVEDAKKALKEAAELEKDNALDPKVRTIIKEVKIEADIKQQTYTELQTQLSEINTKLTKIESSTTLPIDTQNSASLSKDDSLGRAPLIKKITISKPAEVTNTKIVDHPSVQATKILPTETAVKIEETTKNEQRTNGPIQIREMLAKLTYQPGITRADAINELLNVITEGAPFKKGEAPALETINRDGLLLLTNLLNELAQSTSEQLPSDIIIKYATTIHDALAYTKI